MKLQVNLGVGTIRGWKDMMHSPFSSQLLQEEIPTHYVMLKFNFYGSTGDLMKHIYHLCLLMTLVDD